MSKKTYTTDEAIVMARRLGFPMDTDLIEQLRVGMQVEHEHDDLIGGSSNASAAIAAAHLREDPLYYLPLLALERYRDGEKQVPNVHVALDELRGKPVLSLHVQGLDTPIWGAEFDSKDTARDVREFLAKRPALAIVYAWMMLHHPE